ncbi:hypothetical protein AEAC466_19340 [Asticcacaulis sp. AC466]|uniref:hypothetical protein n=1 Tax=Asticcacaulis sp. AC466 TaxID=1282362 RepID=UPI0003C3ED1B|nr:hypothetical protein [Asticcacaulis sp. AC466]ESQ82074.1 hypothetical protein AEAC466_19340 [Asticcacaulis sp. AC466]
MAIFEKDGVTLIPELADDVILRSNLLDCPVCGRDQVAAVLRALEGIYLSATDIFRKHLASRDYIVTLAILASDARFEIIIVGVRDDSGWISTVIMNHESKETNTELAALLNAKLSRQLVRSLAIAKPATE